jgi:aspartyl protease family protein
MSNRTVDLIFYAMLLLLPASALIARRPPLGQTLKYALAWIGVFGVGLLLINQRDRLPTLSGLLSGQHVSGTETRINQDSDGHFYASATLDGVSRRLLVDSGATTTALSVGTAREIGLNLEESTFPAILETANGRVTARTATVRRIELGGVVTTNLSVVVSPAFGDSDVLGMNFLSRLESWRVEGRTLILTPNITS